MANVENSLIRTFTLFPKHDTIPRYGQMVLTSWDRTGHMLCIVDTSLSVLMSLRICLRELCCLLGIFYCLDLNHLVRVFYLFMFS